MSDTNARTAWTIKEMQESLHCGRQTALKIATDADAVFRCGRRIFIMIPKVEKYMNNNTI